MKKLISFLFTAICLTSFGQDSPTISDMKWGADFNIHITFSNDSSSIHEIKGLYHSKSNFNDKNEVTYYPVKLDDEFLKQLKDRDINSLKKDSDDSENKQATLWSAIHSKIGGGYIHFINSIIYSLESNQLSLTAPLMKRQESEWKPKPMTESFKRTKKWEYYAPNNIKYAQKEYKIKNKKGELGDIKLLPQSFIDLFLNANKNQIEEFARLRETNKLAILDMIKLMVGANYLGQEQIDYVKNSVINSVVKYNVNSLPSVIIFDDFGAAVAMSLDSEGYKIGKIVFDNEANLSEEQVRERVSKMEAIISGINEANKKVFEKNLKQYYN